jgi:NAD(P)-dependent dehydrogenase (short-subunit alcohol dehydrogenase family)
MLTGAASLICTSEFPLKPETCPLKPDFLGAITQLVNWKNQVSFRRATMTDALQNKILIVTGSTGVAAATARMACAEGAKVFIVGNDETTCSALADEIEGDYFVADVSRGDRVAEAVRRCAAKHERVDSLFNVVGISGRRLGDGPVHECSEQGWDAVMETNVKSVFLMSREVLRLMLNQSLDQNGMRGSILNMASALAFSPEPKFFSTHAYAASKSAIIGLTRTMASYYAPHKIRVNAVAPALTRTPMSLRAQQDRAILDFMRIKQPLSEDLIEAEDVARAALFLLGDEAR